MTFNNFLGSYVIHKSIALPAAPKLLSGAWAVELVC